MKKIIILCLFSCMLVGCITEEKCLQRFPTKESRDSVYIETLQKVPVYIPGDTINISVPANCPDQDLVSIENQKLRQDIKILNGKLVSNTEIKTRVDTVKVISIKTTVNEVKVPEPVKYIPQIYRDALWICIIVFTSGFAWLGWKAYKFFKN